MPTLGTFARPREGPLPIFKAERGDGGLEGTQCDPLGTGTFLLLLYGYVPFRADLKSGLVQGSRFQSLIGAIFKLLPLTRGGGLPGGANRRGCCGQDLGLRYKALIGAIFKLLPLTKGGGLPEGANRRGCFGQDLGSNFYQ